MKKLFFFDFCPSRARFPKGLIQELEQQFSSSYLDVIPIETDDRCALVLEKRQGEFAEEEIEHAKRITRKYGEIYVSPYVKVERDYDGPYIPSAVHLGMRILYEKEELQRRLSRLSSLIKYLYDFHREEIATLLEKEGEEIMRMCRDVLDEEHRIAQEFKKIKEKEART